MKAESTTDYIEASTWKTGLQRLRSLLLSFDLVEELKWGVPHYLMDGKILIGLAGFKSYFGLWFHQGVFLDDTASVLTNAQEGKTKALRQWRFKSADEIDETLVRAYIAECIQNHKEGKAITPRKKKLVIPRHLLEAMDQERALKEAFETMSPGKQKEYAEYISEAKQDATKKKRLDKCIPLIIKGKGLNDRYKTEK